MAAGIRTFVKGDPLRKRRFRFNLQNLDLRSFHWEGGHYMARLKYLLFNLTGEDSTEPTPETVTVSTFPKNFNTPPSDLVPIPELDPILKDDVDHGEREEEEGEDDQEGYEEYEEEHGTEDGTEEGTEESTDSVITFDWENMAAFTSPSLEDPLIRERRSSRIRSSRRKSLNR